MLRGFIQLKQKSSDDPDSSQRKSKSDKPKKSPRDHSKENAKVTEVKNPLMKKNIVKKQHSFEHKSSTKLSNERHVQISQTKSIVSQSSRSAVISSDNTEPQSSKSAIISSDSSELPTFNEEEYQKFLVSFIAHASGKHKFDCGPPSRDDSATYDSSSSDTKQATQRDEDIEPIEEDTTDVSGSKFSSLSPRPPQTSTSAPSIIGEEDDPAFSALVHKYFFKEKPPTTTKASVPIGNNEKKNGRKEKPVISVSKSVSNSSEININTLRLTLEATLLEISNQFKTEFEELLNKETKPLLERMNNLSSEMIALQKQIEASIPPD
jgi:hypothetical protein